MKTSRRNFIAGASAFAAAIARHPGEAATSAPGKVSFCAFADIHHFPGYWPHSGREWLDRILDRAKTEKTDFTIQLGDMVHDVVRERDYLAAYNGFSQSTYHVVGNHDGERNRRSEMLEAFGLEKANYMFERAGFRFIVFNPNYFLAKDGTFVAYERYNLFHANKAGAVAKGCIIPPEQVEWIRDAVEGSSLPCVLFSHESIERDGSAANAREVRSILEDANRRHPGRVRLVVNGHHHIDYVRVAGDIVYLDLNSATYQYFVKPHGAYPEEYVKKNLNSRHAIAWNDPLSAVITLDAAAGSVEIKGSHSTCMFGVTPEKAGYSPYDPLGRPALPCIRSFRFEKKFS